ncbi:MAG: FAD-dependent oxidoreductase, partial [Actinomycetales bacterium]
MPEIPDRAQIVVIGGGIVGASVAYHLTKLGMTDLVLLEQGQLSCGTTWHAAGLVGQLRATEAGTRLVQYSASLYAELEAETGLATGYKQCGGVTVARTPERMTQLLRTAASAEAYNLQCEVISAERAQELYPILHADDLLGALWLPLDGTANPADVTQSLARGARMRGAQICERVRVTGIDVQDGRVCGVQTDAGPIEAQIVVNCAGQWAKAIGALCGVTVPLHSAEHFYVVTEQIAGVHRDYPVLRDPDGYTYVKEEVGGLVVGGFEPEAKPWVSPDALPYPFEFQLLEEDWDHFAILMDSALHRLPVLAETGIKKFYNGPESFTPDNQFILGEAPNLRNFYVAAGFNSVGIASAGGAGRALAEWIAGGEPASDLVSVDIRRFAPFQGNNQWLRARVGEVLGLHYAVPWPNRELTTARPFRCSPLHDRIAAANACFGSRMGWERPNFFAPAGQIATIEYSWGRQDWFDWVNDEQSAVRHAVALFDETSFGKIRITGPDAMPLLQRICTADTNVEVGRVVYTAVLNSRGTYEADVTITRKAQDEYWWITSSASIIRDLAWLNTNRGDFDVSLADISEQLAVLGVMGPNARALLSQVSSADLVDFPFASSRSIDIGPFTV